MEASFRVEGNKIYFSFTRCFEDLEQIENLTFGMSEIEPYVKINDELFDIKNKDVNLKEKKIIKNYE